MVFLKPWLILSKKDKMKIHTKEFGSLKIIKWKFLTANVVIESRKSIDGFSSMLDIAEKGVSKIEKGLYKMFQYIWKATRNK